MVYTSVKMVLISEGVTQIELFSAAQDGQLFQLFKLLDELEGIQDRNKAINTVRSNYTFRLYI